MTQTFERQRVAHTSDTVQRLLEHREQLQDHAEYLLAKTADIRDSLIAAERLIDQLSNQSWKNVLTYRYIAQLGWKEIGERMGTSDSAAKMMCARAIEHLDAIVDK